MASLNDKFDKASKVLIDMSNEVELLRVRYGAQSKLVLKKQDDLNALLEMQDAAIREMANMRRMAAIERLNHKLTTAYILTGAEPAPLLELLTKK